MPFIVIIVAFLLIAGDQISKHFIDLIVKPIGNFDIIPGFFSFNYLENRGAALGILQNQRWLFIALTILLCAGIVVCLFAFKKHTKWSYAALCLILAGGVGNLIDRIFRGYVIDFLYFHFFPYKFNVADCFVTVGAILMIIAVLLYDDGTKKKAAVKHAREE